MASHAEIPAYWKYFNPILEGLRALGGSATNEELNSRVAADMKLSDDLVAIPHDAEHGGQSEVSYRIAWGRSYLKFGGFITNSERGVWALTPAGSNAGHIDEKVLIKEVQARFKKKKEAKDGSKAGREHADDVPGEEEGIANDWKHALLETLQVMDPSAFERLCQRLLREMGFDDVRVTGRTGDGGIDGVGLLRLQEVVTVPVIFQAKRWQNPVSPKTVREFRGAMHARTDKGLIITTSYFTPDAKREAVRDGAASVDLIDGEKLMDLLRKFKLGVKTEMVERVTVVAEWFKAM